MSTAATRILHLHVEKCGGTALRVAMEQAIGPGARVFPKHHERDLKAIRPEQWDLISGHFGWQLLRPLGGRIVTMLRDPVDRFISSYFYWRDMYRAGHDTSHRSALADLYSLDDFVTIKDDHSLITQLFNRMTWQVAFSGLPIQRQAQRALGMTDAQLLAVAVANLEACDVVGLQERMGEFAGQFERRLGLKLAIERTNVTAGRPARLEISGATRRRIHEWVYLDMELYQAAAALVAARFMEHAA
ncbi:MAG: sulfotransferase family 2 domain-containing protein [Rhodospirillales bacterium]